MGANNSRKSTPTTFSPNPVYRANTKISEKSPAGVKVFAGNFVHSLSWKDPCVIKHNGIVGVKDGKILFMNEAEDLEILKKTHSFDDNDILKLKDGEFIMPGFIDTHIHASQYPNSGLGLDLPLLEWLEKYTYPLESKFKDKAVAEEVYKKVVERTLNNGTTTASYYTFISKEAALAMVDLVETYGQRALVGKICVDCNTENYYIETKEEALADTKEFVKAVLDRKNPLVRPIITPAFALTCSEDLQKGLGELAKEHDLHIQTHLSESLPEVQKAKELFPQSKNYADIFASTGVLSNKTIVAHCVHLTDEELNTLKENNTGVSHCPTSNICLLSGLCPVRKIRDAGVKVGLGTDVSGGYSASIIEAMRHAIITGKCLQINGKESAPITYREAFYLATLGGAEALALDKDIGNFRLGKSFDALVINLESNLSTIDVFPENTVNDLVQKFIMLGDDRNITKVFVNGQLVKHYN